MARYDDAPDRRSVVPLGKPGELPRNRIPIFNQNGVRKGHVGHRAGPPTVARFGIRDAKLGKVDGRTAWIGHDDAGARRQAAIKRVHDLRAAKGSVTHTPTRPQTSARPRRGG